MAMSGPRRGFTLVEVLIAALVLVMVVVPLIGLLTSGKTDQQSEEGMSEAVAFCQEMMEKIVSNNLPFSAIDPGGGAGLATGAGFNTSVKQAGFKNTTVRSQSFTATDLEKIINDEPGQPERVRKVKGKKYFVYFFAGKYPDRPPVNDTHETGFRRADIDETLTFSYVTKPAGYGLPYLLDAAKFNRQTILNGDKVNPGNMESSPYVLGSYLVQGGPSPQVEKVNDRARPYFYRDTTRTFPDKPGQELLSGWPDPTTGGFTEGSFNFDLNDSGGEQRRLWAKHLRAVAVREKTPNIGYHPVTLDQKEFKETGGAFMKVILGVKFAPYEHSHLRKNSGDNMREFWLVSFKSNLED
jgi:prepilin-type N-terminal cleavage/methylation domain-containing protein